MATREPPPPSRLHVLCMAASCLILVPELQAFSAVRGPTKSVASTGRQYLLSPLASAPRGHADAPLSMVRQSFAGVEKARNSEAAVLHQETGGDDEDERKKRDRFNLNVSRCLDYLSDDVPGMFQHAPRLEIFTDNVVLKDPVGELCRGKRVYGALHTSLRVLSAITAVKPRVEVPSIFFNKGRREIEVTWKITAGAPFTGGDAMKMSAISSYRLDDEGIIYEHSLDNRIKRDLWEYSNSWMGVLAGDRPPAM